MKSLPRLPLNALRVFEAVARHGSMARAAEALNVLPSAVSMQMKSLANYVGAPLVVMRGRRLELTPHGERLLPAITGGLGQIDEVIASLRDDVAVRPFTLTVVPNFLHLWLVPRLPAFEAEHPSFQLQILSNHQVVDLARENVDAGIRLGAGCWEGVESTKLLDEWLVPVCAPALRKRVGHLERGALPKGVKLIHGVEPWSLWTGGSGPPEPATVAVHESMVTLAEAERGQGIALLRASLCEFSFKAGRLIAIGERIPYRFDYYWVVREHGASKQRGDVLLRWLRTQVEAG